MDQLNTFHGSQRRGVLLLVVLSMLTLFMMLGVSYIVVATRARKSARAFANNVVAATAAGVADQALLDQAFLMVVRGSAEPLTAANQATALGTNAGGGESLLGDKYGTPIPGASASTTITGSLASASAFPPSDPSAAFFQISTGNLTPAPSNPSDLVGRVITFSLPGLSASTRILQASGAANTPTLVVAAGPTVSGRQLSAADVTAAKGRVIGSGSSTFIINGREFAGSIADTNEAWDGVDARNPLLPGIKTEDINGNGLPDSGEDANGNSVLDANLVLATTTMGYGSGLPAVDNDSDGTADSKFVDIGLPPVVSPNGTVLLPRAAILVAELDGRLNLNVHGSATDESAFDTTTTPPRDMYPPVTTLSGGTAVPLYQLPRGMGTGPADVSIDRSLLFGASPATNQQRVANATLALSGALALTASQQDVATKRYLPRIKNVEGRYGDTVSGAAFGGAVSPMTSAKAGVSGTNDQWSAVADQWRCSLTGSNTAMSYFTSPGRYGSPPDLKGLLKVWADDAGQPVYYRPFWTGDPGSVVSGNLSNEAVDDPYDVNLTRSAVRGGVRNPSAASVEPADSLFSPADLEGLLRFGDPDTMKLSRRLVALFGTSASSNRLAVTTESWDTPAITGDAWQQVINGPYSTFLNTAGTVYPKRPQDLFSPETLQGHRMDLNRPFHDAPNYNEPNDPTGTTRRQAFARQLYCLLVAIVRTNGTTLTPAVAEQLAQYAINVVDFRDADSVMTQFKYDPTFGPGNTAWNPGTNNYVWGCERPEILITETWAWHNRRTDDLNTNGQVVDAPTTTADDDFDQQRRPQGAFFVELFSPWSSSAYRYGSVGSGTVSPVTDANKPSERLRAEPLPAELANDEDLNGDGVLDNGEDINGNGQLDMRAWHNSSINLSGTASSDSPIWRLVTVRGSNAFGTDPVVPATTNSSLSILDPARPGSTALVDRAFYFAQPSSAIQTSTGNNSAFWQQTAGGKCPNAQTYVVVGTDAPFSPLTSGTAPADVRVLKGAAGQPATISEPLAATDPYDAMMQAASPGNAYTAPAPANSNVGTWASPIDQPLDADTSPPAGITSSPFLDGAHPLLMTNGTHDNFAVVHLQRLANPTLAWNANTNPYLTIDSMTVDLTVVNASNAGDNYDEPGTTGAAPLAYLATQKDYGHGIATTVPTSTDRGGKLSQISGSVKPSHDIWSAVVDAATTPIPADDADSFRTDTATPRAATQPTPGTPKGTLANSAVIFSSTAHTLQKTPERFYDTANSKTYPFAWLFWPNRPYQSATELAFVPATSPFTLLRWHTTGAGLPRPFAHLPGYFEAATPSAPWNAVSGRNTGSNNPSFWQFLHVPTPYAGLYPTVPNSASVTVNTPALTELGLDIFPLRHLSRFREPGRINVNTIADRRVWRGLFGAVTDRNDLPNPTTTEPACEKLPGWKPTLFMTTSGTGGTPCVSPVAFMQSLPAPGSNTAPANPRSGGFLDVHVNEDKNGNSVIDTEDVNNNGVLDAGEDVNSNSVIDTEDTNGNGILDRNDYRDTDRHAFFRYQTMNRLNNSVSTRSNVFAVWVTIGYFDENAATTEVLPVKRHRAFYIFDRSIPVGYEPGKNHNVLDAVLLRRIIQ